MRVPRPSLFFFKTQRYKPSGTFPFLRYKAFSLAFVKSSMVTWR